MLRIEGSPQGSPYFRRHKIIMTTSVYFFEVLSQLRQDLLYHTLMIATFGMMYRSVLEEPGVEGNLPARKTLQGANK